MAATAVQGLQALQHAGVELQLEAVEGEGLAALVDDLEVAAALALAVAAMTAVGFFTDRVGQGVQARSAEVLAADLVVRSNRPIAAEHQQLARQVDCGFPHLVHDSTIVVRSHRTVEGRRNYEIPRDPSSLSVTAGADAHPTPATRRRAAETGHPERGGGPVPR